MQKSSGVSGVFEYSSPCQRHTTQKSHFDSLSPCRIHPERTSSRSTSKYPLSTHCHQHSASPDCPNSSSISVTALLQTLLSDEVNFLRFIWIRLLFPVIKNGLMQLWICSLNWSSPVTRQNFPVEESRYQPNPSCITFDLQSILPMGCTGVRVA